MVTQALALEICALHIMTPATLSCRNGCKVVKLTKKMFYTLLSRYLI